MIQAEFTVMPLAVCFPKDVIAADKHQVNDSKRWKERCSPLRGNMPGQASTKNFWQVLRWEPLKDLHGEMEERQACPSELEKRLLGAWRRH